MDSAGTTLRNYRLNEENCEAGQKSTGVRQQRLTCTSFVDVDEDGLADGLGRLWVKMNVCIGRAGCPMALRSPLPVIVIDGNIAVERALRTA